MLKYFGESFRYTEGNEAEEEDAKLYLELWKKNLLSKLSRDSFQCKIVDEQWIARAAYLDGALNSKATLSLKLCLEATWEYEL